jgi:hypothetical protein
MCIFSSNVESVSSTEIFARLSTIDKQFLVYRMDYEANQELAMILPLPTPPMSPENAVQFIDLSGYPEFFEDMNKGFSLFDVASGSKGLSRSMSTSFLDVKQVGNFEASFVPSLKDFDRLDPRFCLPENVWHLLPQYQDYGFAVFKLKPGNLAAHPMAFEFPTRPHHFGFPTVFFPTVHVHNGEAEPFAKFDHTLYLQSKNRVTSMLDDRVSPTWNVSQSWSEKEYLAHNFIYIDKTKGIVDGKMAIQRTSVKGQHLNLDCFVKVS